ncbi:hypothetical protein VTJ04DRAFT_9566 [Mycothermus thermophilus]|uniref:uncharacterized protein n=1 Tax=Humicola insolens TaxID=85995 RepID=UPI003742E4EE
MGFHFSILSVIFFFLNFAVKHRFSGPRNQISQRGPESKVICTKKTTTQQQWMRTPLLSWTHRHSTKGSNRKREKTKEREIHLMQ